MRIVEVRPLPEWILEIRTDDGRSGLFDVRPYLGYEIFQPLKDQTEFVKVVNGGYFIEWECGADLSADTIDAHLQQVVAVR